MKPLQLIMKHNIEFDELVRGKMINIFYGWTKFNGDFRFSGKKHLLSTQICAVFLFKNIKKFER